MTLPGPGSPTCFLLWDLIKRQTRSSPITLLISTGVLDLYKKTEVLKSVSQVNSEEACFKVKVAPSKRMSLVLGFEMEYLTSISQEKRN